MKISLVIGHKASSQGAVNPDSGLTEFQFNATLAKDIAERLDHDAEIVYRNKYSRLPGEINKLKPDLVVSLHCNSFNRAAHGSEVLFYHRSKRSRDIAGIFLKHFTAALSTRDRGIKPKTAEDRGGYLLRYTKAPAVLCEPFFIDNNTELARVLDRRDMLVDAYVNAINEAMRYLQK